MGRFHDRRFPGEDDAYRSARDGLLEAEAALRKRIEEVAALRRALPPGGPVPEDYVFEEGAADLADRETVRQTKLSELFAPGRDSLVVYGFMYAPGGEPCPMCTSFLDSLDGNAPHISQRVNLAVVAKAPIGTIRAWAAARGWTNLRLLSSGDSSYNSDYFAETPDGEQIPSLNVFQRTADGIRHAYSPELLFAPAEEGQNPRHVDLLWPLWNFLDLTPTGRETDWYPSVKYD
jgi:predicted dithiol-disulfide oxidoreductase (DUF899 family)